MSGPASRFSRLARWEDKLDLCIQCGYCYEHCPIYKHTRWETDAPRAKLAILYGLLTGALEPSSYIAEKLYECFNCKRCEANCSASVPVTEIFADARADLMELGYAPEGTLSLTNHGACARCLNCIRICKHEARSYDPETNKIVVDPVACQSCGACMDLCPRVGVSIRHGFGTNPEELIAQVAAYLEETRRPAPRAVVFSCSWSNWPGYQSAEPPPDTEPDAHKTLVNVCAGRLEMQTVLDSLARGAWGVLVTACPPDDCEHDGSRRARQRITALRQTLTEMGVDPRRVQLREVGKTDAAGFKKAVNAFMEDVQEMGPLPG